LNIGLNLAGTGRKRLDILGDAELEVSLLTPARSPRVTDFPIFRAFVLIFLSIFK
jgi:hypothetical protein